MSDLVLLAGCFWGIDYSLQDLHVDKEVGYAGGEAPDGTTYYNLDRSGHSEALRVRGVTPDLLPEILQRYLEKSRRDPSPASKPRYRRAVLCSSEDQARIVRELMAGMGQPDWDVVVGYVFQRAEDYHQNYYCRRLG